ncbi:hypothetical protein JOF55_000093 [Haloactinomyces albus]|uniref:2Fe-2S ferredoxin-type domain-containing protein n=1 Tax=Haloactinomyces albus TaxID=1352928 RepID=A0AAE3Z7S6_9ACTN|nr:2Fe-2S iron-sulfur cluster binding domain-containing protein [Haloactinomyces albus]MDR7299912.1 hypothetical protein [Haloactinomyces albus]
MTERTEVHGDRLEVHVDDEGTWLERDLPLPNLRYETFGNSGWFEAEEFVVRVPGHGVETTVGTGESPLDALERADVDVMFDCRKGECGLCQVDIVPGPGRRHDGVDLGHPQ